VDDRGVYYVVVGVSSVYGGERVVGLADGGDFGSQVSAIFLCGGDQRILDTCGLYATGYGQDTLAD